MSALWAAPAVAQAVLMFVDEIYFHFRRGLPRWERLGHPVDTIFILVPLMIARFSAWSPAARSAFVAAAVLSILIITKDEWVHARECRPGEHWVHALLFALHPLVLVAAAVLRSSAWGQTFLSVQIAAILFCLGHQVVYWNFWKVRA